MKKYETKEECLAVNGEHAWEKYNPNEIAPGVFTSCAVMHYDGHCPDNDPAERCYHCPAIRRYSVVQREVKEWVESV